ncbi:hypothetical protein B0H16DRAFT_1387856 [Mycena metata]|uniref:HAMP domain-containing protein n=1 Tax=Mycena metata TaxID=1033252 RepID=A0AAD7HE45_9AGAR|nr:hypothetical protein B0H16DRAFT_1387856 [Mycena metata]
MDALEELRLLKDQVRDVSRVCNAVATGDLTQKITVPVQGDLMVQLKKVINTMVDNLSHFATEVTRVSRDVGTEGKLGAQAHVEDVEGTWRELMDEVNTLAANLTTQVRGIAAVTSAVAKGDLSKQIDVDASGEILDLKNTVNGMVLQLRMLAVEVTRVTLEVGSQGKLGGEATVPDVEGVWFELVTNVNRMCLSLTDQVRSIATVTTAVARGDLSQKVTIHTEGEINTLKDTVNRMVDQLSAFASEVTRVAVEVGTAGKLGGQARVEGVQGTWKDLTDNVNKMASNLTWQVRSISEVTKAVANGDLGKTMEVDVSGEMLDLKVTINEMVMRLGNFSREVTRVALEVGTEGKLGGQAEVEGVQGTWKDLTDNVNKMASNLTNQVRSISLVTKAVAYGDLSKEIDVDVRGEMLDLKVTINEMVTRLGNFSREVTRVALEVGTEGKLGGQAEVEGVQGTWKDLTDNVNRMASNLTTQVRSISLVTKAVAYGDLTRTIDVEASGEILDLKVTINEMVERLGNFSSEVTRVALEVGTEGRLGGQAKVEGVQGTWRDLTDNVNKMASNLTDQVRGISLVTKAVAYGDLSKKIHVGASGEMLDLKVTINEMVERLGNFSSEVTRVAGEVGTEGKLGGQAEVEGVQGTWKDLTDNVNKMASNLTNQVRSISLVTKAVAYGDLSKKIHVGASGEMLDLKVTINEMVERLGNFSSEVTRVALEVGTEGKLGGQAEVEGVQGTWKDLTDNVNKMASNLTNQVRSISLVTKAVAYGDLSKEIDVDVRGEMLDLKVTINEMVTRLGNFSREVTRVALEVGTEGKLGGQAEVEGVQGTWKDLTDNVNRMASNLTNQVRSISLVTKAVAYGDLTRTIDVEASGEILDLKVTINEMVERLGNFSSEVTRVAREVGTEGKLGGQAEVKGVQGTWKDLTDNVNVMAQNLTLQIRTISDATNAVAEGDLTEKIAGLSVSGEMLSLVNNINNLRRRQTTIKLDPADPQEQTSTEDVEVPITTIAPAWKPGNHLQHLGHLYTAVFLFGLPGRYVRDVPPHTLLGGENWIEASRIVHKRWTKEWTQMGTAAGVLFSVLFTVLQITSAAYDPAVRTVVQLSIVCLFFGVIYALVLSVTFGKLQLGVMRIITENPSREAFWNLWVMLSMPLVWITWGGIYFVIFMAVFFWRSGASNEPDDDHKPSPDQEYAPRAITSILMIVGVVYFILSVRLCLGLNRDESIALRKV